MTQQTIPGPKERFYISLSGIIGSGKTTAANLLARHFGMHLFEENVDENTFLPLFYDDPKRWAFHSQLFFLREKAEQLMRVKSLLIETSVVQDSPIYQDCFTYAKAQQTLGYMSLHEFMLYEKFFRALHHSLPVPHLIVQLDASIPAIANRIKKRAREYEQEIDTAYLQLLLELQTEWIVRNPQLNIIRINSDELDFASNEEDARRFLEVVERHIRILSPYPGVLQLGL